MDKPDPLGPADFNTPTWRRLTHHLEQVRAKCIDDLIRPQMDETVTHRLRGRIKQINELLALDKPAPAPSAAPEMRSHEFDSY